MASRKQAPRREVVEVERRGDWGAVRYVHKLVCGHMEIRKRPAPASHIACLMCLQESMRPAPRGGDWDRIEVDPFATAEAEAARIRAALAARVGVPNESVSVMMDSFGRVAYATVFVDGDTARRMA